MLTWTRPTPSEGAAGLVALLLCVGFSTGMMLSSWSLRFAVLLAVLLVGALMLGALAAQRDLAACLAVGLVAWALLGGSLSDNPRVALLGQLGKEWSLLILVGVLAVWALGRWMPTGGDRVLRAGVVVGLGLQAFIGLVQVLVQNEGGDLGLQAGRARGLTANPVYLGALMAGAAAFCAVSALRSRDRAMPWIAGVAAFAAVTNLSGSRIAVASAAVVLIGFVALDRSRRGIVVMAAAAAGVLAAELLFRALGSSETSGAGRATTLAGDGRRALWGYGVDAVTEQPLLGWGLGRFRAAVQGDFSPHFVRNSAPNEATSSWFDAHNIVLEFAITTGLVGCLLFVAFVAFAIRRARGPFLALFLGIALTWMLQPASVSTAPLAFLALGAAAPRLAPDEARARWLPVAMRVATVVGIVIGAYYVVADWRLAVATDSAELDQVEAAAAWLPPDAVIADLVARAAGFDFQASGSSETWIAKSERTVELEPDRPLWWVDLAARHFFLRNDREALAALEHAVELEPWHPIAWSRLEQVATRLGDAELAAEAHRRNCIVNIAADSCASDDD